MAWRAAAGARESVRVWWCSGVEDAVVANAAQDLGVDVGEVVADRDGVVAGVEHEHRCVLLVGQEREESADLCDRGVGVGVGGSDAGHVGGRGARVRGEAQRPSSSCATRRFPFRCELVAACSSRLRKATIPAAIHNIIGFTPAWGAAPFGNAAVHSFRWALGSSASGHLALVRTETSAPAALFRQPLPACSRR